MAMIILPSIALIAWLLIAAVDAALPNDRTLPENLIVGYANWNECDDKLVTAVEDGVNVLIWFAINLLANETTGEPIVTGGPNLTCVKRVQAEIRAKNLPTIHLISVGGWDAPHPNTSNPVSSVYANWVAWNDEVFDGFDWDIEGNDDINSPNNILTLEALQLMGEMSQMAKRDGFVVSMAPAESYMDPTFDTADGSLTHRYPEWDRLQPDFTYHGRNCYTYLLSAFGTSTVASPDGDILVPTFDFVSIQLYEGYSHLLYNTTEPSPSPSLRQKQSAIDYLVKLVPRLVNGFSVDLMAFGLPTTVVSIPSTRLVLGFANGWADNSKFALIWPEVIGAAYALLEQDGIRPRGAMFWDIADEGMDTPDPMIDNISRPLWMARGMNSFLHTRIYANATQVET